MPNLVAKEYISCYSFSDDYNWAIFDADENKPLIKGLCKESIPFYMSELSKILEKKNVNTEQR